jgi:hypothetical protein
MMAAALTGAGATLVCGGGEAHAATAAVSWVGGSGSWSTPANRSSGTVPPADTAVMIVHNDAASRSITFDADYPTTPLHRFVLDQTGTGTTTFTMSSGNFGALAQTTDDFEFIGMNGHASFVQTGGSNIGGYYNQLHLGENPGSGGIYTLSGGTLNMGVIECGVLGNGTLNLTGGVANTSGVEIGVAFANGTIAQARGTLNISGAGSLVASTEFCGNGGIGHVIQSGGAQWLDALILGSSEGASGTYNLSGGTLRTRILDVGAGAQFASGTGFFDQTGGSVTNTQSLYLGAAQMGTGTWNLSGGSLTVGGDFFVGWYGHASFVVGPGGNLSIAGGYLDVAEKAGSAGTFTSNGNSFNTIADDIGVAGAGTFIQNGGTRITTRIILGDEATSTGTYILTSGMLNVGNEYIGALGVGIFNQSGGVHRVGDYLTLSDEFTFGCAYNLSGGTVSATLLNNLFGAFTQTGGVATFSNGVIGQEGTVNVSGSGKLYTSQIDQFAVNVGTGGVIVCAAHPGASGPGNISYVRELSITGTGKWDLGNNDLVINYCPIPVASDMMRGSGDANLDGTVDTLDFNALAGHFGGNGEHWSHADFNYDGVVDTLDFNALAGNFGQTLPAGEAIGATSLVAEPAALATLLCFGTIASRRRRARCSKRPR